MLDLGVRIDLRIWRLEVAWKPLCSNESITLKNTDNASQDTLSLFSIFVMSPSPEEVSSTFSTTDQSPADYSDHPIDNGAKAPETGAVSDQSSSGRSAHQVEDVGIVAKTGAASGEGSLVDSAAVTQMVPMSPNAMSPSPERAPSTNSTGHSDHLVEHGAKVPQAGGISAEGSRLPALSTPDQSPPGHGDHLAKDAAGVGTAGGKDSSVNPAAMIQPTPMSSDATSNSASHSVNLEGGGIVAQTGTGKRYWSNLLIMRHHLKPTSPSSGRSSSTSDASAKNAALHKHRKVKNALRRTDTYNIVICGETGAGKSSLVNLITNIQDMAPTSFDTTRCTVKTRVYPHAAKIRNQTLQVQLFDTVDLDEGSKGTVPNQRAQNVLKKHLKIPRKKGAIHLLMYCVRGKEDIGALQRNYKSLYSKVNQIVPIVLVITGLEDQKPDMEEWWKTHEKSISEHEMTFVDHACITTMAINETDADELKQRRVQSYDAVCNLIEKYYPQNGMGVPTDSVIATPAKKPKNIVLFGEAGAGKSSLVNLMAGTEVAVTSLSMQRCTLDWKEYAIEFDGESYKVFDTIGLEESGLEMNEYLSAVANAYTFIKRLDAEGGVDLLLFCIRAGRFTAALQSNYRFFHDFLCQKKVPIVLAITNLEREQRMEDWWDREHAIFPRHQIHVAGHACITAASGLDGRHQQLYEDSRIAIRKLVKDNIAGEHHQVWTGGNNLFVSLVRGLKNLLVKNSHVRKMNLTGQLMKSCGMSRETAGQLADMIEKGEVKETV